MGNRLLFLSFLFITNYQERALIKLPNLKIFESAHLLSPLLPLTFNPLPITDYLLPITYDLLPIISAILF